MNSEYFSFPRVKKDEGKKRWKKEARRQSLTCPPTCWPIYPQTYPFIRQPAHLDAFLAAVALYLSIQLLIYKPITDLPVHFDAFFLANQEGLPVQSPTGLQTHGLAQSLFHLSVLMLSFHWNLKTSAPVYSPDNLHTHRSTNGTYRPTFSAPVIYLFFDASDWKNL